MRMCMPFKNRNCTNFLNWTSFRYHVQIKILLNSIHTNIKNYDILQKKVNWFYHLGGHFREHLSILAH